jgi:spermidine/putrescine-binding protein
MLNFEEIYYPTPNKAVYEKLPKDVQEDTLVFPTDEAIANSEVYKTLDKDTTRLLGDLWKELKVY